MERQKRVLRKYVPNYRMNLIDAGHMEEAELQRLSEDLQQVLGMLKYRGRRKELQGYIQKNEKYFSSVDAETYQALCSFLNMENGIKEVEAMQKEERVNMCQALEEWYQDALKEGEVKGRESGRGEGIALAKKVFRLSAEGRTEAEIAKEAGNRSGRGARDSEIKYMIGRGFLKNPRPRFLQNCKDFRKIYNRYRAC